MDIFSVFTLCGGLAFFLYGMTTMSKSLEKMAGGKLEQLLKRMTSNPFKSLLLGAGITIAIQSSSAMTVMLVGLVNSGVMTLDQTVGIIMGSNIGTTLTAWILSLTGLESESLLINMAKPENFSPILALIGVILIMGSKKQRRRDIGRIMVGFAILMYGMELMKDSVSPLADMPQFSQMLTAFTNPLLGVAVGAIFTGVIQSSAASVGILQALALTGSITYGMAIPIIMGQNIGTCVTALLSSIGVNRNAKRVSVIHISFNIIGTVAGLLLFYGGNALFHFAFVNAAVGAVGIAFCHTVFNVFTTLLLLPFSRQLEKLARKVVQNEDKAEQFAFLDPRL
ncbi:MAG: Na/Pi symporter, partial [Oscillospiraceae bacterium]|nr:Na/Pi symporter [Oscillospiraceae bacterium]